MTNADRLGLWGAGLLADAMLAEAFGYFIQAGERALMQCDVEGAKQNAISALRISDTTPEGWDLAARAFLVDCDDKRAVQFARKAVEVGPDNKRAELTLAACLWQQAERARINHEAVPQENGNG